MRTDTLFVPKIEIGTFGCRVDERHFTTVVAKRLNWYVESHMVELACGN